ncbi:MAG: methyltransferase domain-containing protein [Dehalococcoidia bacterium]
MDEQKAEAFAERIFSDLNAGMSCLSLYLGHQLGLFDSLNQSGPVTAPELAQRTGCHPRYIREWLSCMAAGGYLEYDAASGRFTLPPEHAPALVDPDNPGFAVGVMGWVPSFASVLPKLLEVYRTGGGVSYEDYGNDMMDAQGWSTRPMFVNDYLSQWIPALPDVEAKLQAGGRVVEVGCGVGWSSVALARGIPEVRIDAVDPDSLSLEKARRNAAEAGVADRITFHEAPLEESSLNGPYDLVTAFECLHDMPYPVSVLRRMRELAAPDGAVLIADEAVADTLEENCNFMGHLFYNFSVLHCLPQALVFPDAAGTGTVIEPSTVRRYAQEAGFSRVEVLPIENPMFRFYRLTP